MQYDVQSPHRLAVRVIDRIAPAETCRERRLLSSVRLLLYWRFECQTTPFSGQFVDRPTGRISKLRYFVDADVWYSAASFCWEASEFRRPRDRVSSRVDVGADLFWIQWRNESGRIRVTALNAVAQFRPWESKGFFVKGGAGMAFVRNWVPTTGPNPDNQKALSVLFGGGWEFNTTGRLGLQLFATQHVGALGDLQTSLGPVADVTANFWSLGAAIVIR